MNMLLWSVHTSANLIFSLGVVEEKINKVIAKATRVSSAIFKVFCSPNLMSLCQCSHYRHKRLCHYVVMLLV